MNKTEMKKAFRSLMTSAVLLFDAWLDETTEATEAPRQTAPARAVEEDETPTLAAAPKKRGRKAAENKPTPAAVEEEDTEETDEFSASDLRTEAATGEEDDFADDFGSEEEAEEEITPEALRKMLVDFSKKNSKEEAYKVLGKFKAKKVQDLKPTDYRKVYTALEAAM